MFARHLNEAVLDKKSPLVVGLDPDITKLPPGLKPAATASSTEIAAAIPVSYTHLDVYKRQIFYCTDGKSFKKQVSIDFDNQLSLGRI